MATLNQIIKSFEDFSTSHLQVHTFFSGQTWNFQSITNKYTAVILLPLPSVVQRGMLTLNFNLFVIDQLNKDRSNKDEILSDTLQVLQDYISEFADNEDIYNFTLEEGEEIPIEPLEEELDDVVAGWVATVKIKVPYSGNTCIIPVEEEPIPTSTLIITVKNESDEPLENATVTLTLGGTVIGFYDTDTDGEVTITGLVYGDYIVDVALSGYQDSLGNTITLDQEFESLEVVLEADVV